MRRYVLAALLGLMGCAHLTYVSDDPETYVTSAAPSSMVVSTVRGDRIGVSSPRIAADSLMGTSTSRPESTPVAVALADIRGVYVRTIDSGRTLLAITAGIGGLYLLYLFGLASEET